MAGSLPPIVFIKTEVNGIAVRPDTQDLVRKALEGHPIDVRCDGDYINLYHVFRRRAMREPKYAKYAVKRQQIGRSRWIVRILPPKADMPEVQLASDYDPKRGRYKRYAERLQHGKAISVKTEKEAIKARRAWQLYVPGNERKGLRALTRKSGSGYTVRIVVR